MTKEQITEGNKLIAEFMGGHLNTDSQQSRNEWIFPDWHTDQLYYHESWDWLMPSVEKIKILLSGDSYWHEHFPEALETVKIEVVWLAVVEFIKCHNDNEQLNKNT